MGHAIYQAALWGIFASAILTFVALLFFTAPYGRHMRKGWGIALDPRWAWFIMESPAAIAMALMARFGRQREAPTLLFLALWEAHYLYRSLVYPFLLPRSGRRSFPVLLIAIALLYNTANAYVNGFWFFEESNSYGYAWLGDIRFILGITLFIAGFVTHLDSDARLRRLRKPGDNAYSIPYGGLFRYVSSPNYLGEIIEWCGFALASWSFAGLSFAVFTIANLLPRALAHHRWYREHFPDYPKCRRALIPFIL